MPEPPFTTAMVADLFEIFGRSATYTPLVGDAISCRVMVDEEVEGFEGSPGMIANSTVLVFNREEVDSPEPDALVVMGSTTWVLGDVYRRDDASIYVAAREAS